MALLCQLSLSTYRYIFFPSVYLQTYFLPCSPNSWKGSTGCSVLQFNSFDSFSCTLYFTSKGQHPVDSMCIGMACSPATPLFRPYYGLPGLLRPPPTISTTTSPYSRPSPIVQSDASSFKSQILYSILVGLIKINDFKKHMKYYLRLAKSIPEK